MEINRRDNILLVEVSDELRGMRLDQALSAFFEKKRPGEFSRSQITDSIKNSNCKVDSKIVTKPSLKLKGFEKIEISIVPNVSDLIPDDSVEFTVIFEDEHLIVISKPAGLIVHPAPSVKSSTLVHGLYSKLNKLQNSEFSNEPERLGIVHRLDRDTSGIMVIAKTMQAKRALQNQLLPPRKMKRIYHAITYGHPKKKKGSIENYNAQNFIDEIKLTAPIGRDLRNRTRYQIDFSGTLGKIRDSQSTFKILRSVGNFNLIECRLETGRTHQLRVHLEYLESKILGDKVYGPRVALEDKSRYPFIENLSGQMLHAKTLSFFHPLTLEFLTFEAPYYEMFQESLKYLSLE